MHLCSGKFGPKAKNICIVSRANMLIQKIYATNQPCIKGGWFFRQDSTLPDAMTLSTERNLKTQDFVVNSGDAAFLIQLSDNMNCDGSCAINMWFCKRKRINVVPGRGGSTLNLELWSQEPESSPVWVDIFFRHGCMQ